MDWAHQALPGVQPKGHGAGEPGSHPGAGPRGHQHSLGPGLQGKRRWLAWGEFGPGGCEEYNLVTHPIFAGYAYLRGANGVIPTVVGPGGPFDYNKPMNNSKWNTGPQQFPPAEKPIRSYTARGSGGVTGPIYRYDGKPVSSRKFSPHFDKSWFVTVFGGKGMMIFKPNAGGTQLSDSLKWFNAFNFDRALAMEMEPDGALYVFNYAGRYDPTAASPPTLQPSRASPGFSYRARNGRTIRPAASLMRIPLEGCVNRCG